MSGKIVFTYSIANFPTLRCLEQIRNDVCYHNLNVKIVAVGGGLAYGPQGYTHHGVEDLAVMRVLPNMTVLAPGDPVEARLATQAIVDRPGPCYLRLGKAGEPKVHASVPDFQLGTTIPLRSGSAVTLISTGAILYEAHQAVEMLTDIGISAGLISMHTVEPLDSEAILEAAHQSALIMTVEEHSGIGGLHEAVAGVLASTTATKARLLSSAVTSSLGLDAGNQSYLRSRNGLDAHSLVALVRNALAEGMLRLTVMSRLRANWQLTRVRQILGIDRAVAYTLFSRAVPASLRALARCCWSHVSSLLSNRDFNIPLPA